jgi:hypothetical protein
VTHRKITLSRLSKALGIHQNTLRNHLRAHGLYYKRFSDVTDHNIDALIRDSKKHHPKSGIRYAVSWLKKRSLRVPKRRVVESLRRTDSIGVVLRCNKAIQRREYKVARPNALWHLDGHHKLIWWGIVIHGMTDGYLRLVRDQAATRQLN